MKIWRNWNTWALLVWMSNGAVAMENNMLVPQKIKVELSNEPAIPYLNTYQKELRARILIDICSSVPCS